MNGKLITIYGINNIGKSTHAKLVVERLRNEGYEAEYVKYPVYELAPTGPFLNEVLRGEGGQKISEDELQLWFVLNRYQFEPKLKEMLMKGKIVVAEDYVGTGIAWGMAKGLDEDFLVMMNRHLMKENFGILMEGERNLGAREENHVHEQNDELASKCQEVFRHLGEEFGWEEVLVQEKIEDTAKLMWEAIDKFLKAS